MKLLVLTLLLAGCSSSPTAPTLKPERAHLPVAPHDSSGTQRIGEVLWRDGASWMSLRHGHDYAMIVDYQDSIGFDLHETPSGLEGINGESAIYGFRYDGYNQNAILAEVYFVHPEAHGGVAHYIEPRFTRCQP